MKSALIACIFAALAWGQPPPQYPPVGRGRLPPPDPAVLLQGFLDKMTPMQRAHAKLYRRPHSFNLFQDGGVSLDISDTLGNVSSGEPPAETLTDALRRIKCREADAMFAGVVTAAVSNPADDGSFIFTDYTVHVTEWLSMRVPAVRRPGDVVVTRPGGSLVVPARSTISVTAGAHPPIALQSRVLFLVKAVPETGAFRSRGVFDEFPIEDDRVQIRHLFVKDDIPARGLPRNSVFFTLRTLSCVSPSRPRM